MFKIPKVSLLMAGVLLSCSVQAQDLTIHVDKKGKVGFVDKTGAEVIKCQYESAYPFENGYAIVSKGGKSGIIDASGKVVLPLKYNSISSWTKDLYLIKSGKVQGLARKNGDIVLNPSYTFISRLNCYGKALITQGGKQDNDDGRSYIAKAKYGVIDTDGNVLIAPMYNGLYEFTYDGHRASVFSEGYRLTYSQHYLTDTLVTDCSYLGFSKNSVSIVGSGIMDGKGQILLKMGLYDYVMKPENDMVRYYDLGRKNVTCGYHNLNTGKGFVAVTFKTDFNQITFWTHGDFTGSIAPVNGDTWSFIDKEGNVLRSGFSEIFHSKSTGLWSAKESDGKTIVFDEDNNSVSALSGFESIAMPSIVGDQEVFMVKNNGFVGGVNRSGNTVIPFEYDEAMAVGYDIVPVKKNGKWGAVTPSGKEIVPTSYASVIYPSERGAQNLWLTKDDKLYYHFHVGTKKLAPTGYEYVTNFYKSVAHVRPVGMKLESTEVNKAQLFQPNADHAMIDTVNVENYKDSFGYLLTDKDEYLIDMPISSLYITSVANRLEQQNFRPLTEAEKKNLLLSVTRENRSYKLKETLSEAEWDY